MGKTLPHDSQLTLSFESGVSARHRSLRACMAAGGNGDRKRDVGLDAFESYLEKTGDVTPVYYLVDKFLRDGNATRDAALTKLAALADELPALLAAAGVRK